MDQYQLGQEIIAHFNLSGRLWAAQGKPEKCFTSLQAWRIESADAGFGGGMSGGANIDSNTGNNNGGNGFDVSDFTSTGNNFDDDVPF